MSEAPERIFVTSNLIAYEEEFRPLRSTEYVRADHIGELEAKLEKAVDVLGYYSLNDDGGSIARTTLAELTGGKDE